MFTNLNGLSGIDFLRTDSPEELRAQIASIHLPVKILAIYTHGGQHIAWILTEAKIKKIKKGELKNGSST